MEDTDKRKCKKKVFIALHEALAYKEYANKRGIEREKGIPKSLRTFKRLTHAYKCDHCESYHLTSISNTGIRKIKERELYGITGRKYC